MRARLITDFEYNKDVGSIIIKGKYINYEFLNVNVRSIVSEPHSGFSTFTCSREVSFHVNFHSNLLIIKNSGMVVDIMNLDRKALNFFLAI